MLDFVLAIPMMYVLIASTVLLLCFIGFELDFFTGVVVVSTLAYLWLKADFHPIDFVVANWPVILFGLAAYFVFGAIWSVFKWNRITMSDQDKYMDYKKEKLESFNVQNIEDLTSEQAYSYIDRLPMSYPRNVTRSKGMLIGWITGWPFSVLSYVLADLIKDIVVHIYKQLTKVFISIANRNSQEYLADMEKLKTINSNQNRYPINTRKA